MNGRFSKSVVALVSTIALIAAGCGSDDSGSEPESSSGAPADSDSTSPTNTTNSTSGQVTSTVDPSGITRGGTLNVGIDGEAGCYVPPLCRISYGPGAILSAVLDNLTRPVNTAQGYEMELAESIEANDDFTSFTVELKPDVQWSDGDTLVASEIKDLFDNYVLAEDSAIRGDVAVIESIEAPDDSTVIFSLSESSAPFPQLLALVPVWKPTPGLTTTDVPIGTGPFMFETWDPNVATTLVRNPNYWGTDSAGNQLPYLDGMNVTAYTSGDTRVNALDSGQVDLAMSTDPLEIVSLANVSTMHSISLNAGGGIFFNTAKPPIDDVRVRRALGFATNKADILEAIGGGEPRDEYFVPESPWYSEEASAATPGFDPDQAKELLDDYLNDPERSDGEAAGTSLTLELGHVAGAITQESIAALLQQQWQDVGVSVNIAPKDQSTLIGDAISGNYDTTYFGWATPTPYGLLTHNYGPPAETPANYTKFDSPKLQEIIAEMAVAADPQASNDLVHEADMVFAEEMPVLFLHSTIIGWAASDAVGNVPLDPGRGRVEWSQVSLA